MTEIDQEESNTPVNETAGSLLKAAREMAGMSLEQAAEKMHLLKEMVVALEEDDTSNLPSRVFTLGYLKNYARILEVPESRIMELVGDGGGEVEEIRSLQQPHAPQIRSRVRQPGHNGRYLFKALSWLIVISILALLVLWWRGAITLPELDKLSLPSLSGGRESAGEAINESMDESRGGDSETLTLSLGDISAAQDETETATVIETESTTDAPVEVVAETASAPQNPTADENRIELSLEPVDSSGESEDEQSGAEAEDASATDSAVADSSTAVGEKELDIAVVTTPETTVEESSGGGQKITLDFGAVSWVNVSDADQKSVLFGDMAAGSSKTLEGKAPFTFVLGNAAHVRVSVDGRPYDIAPHIRGGVARFVLGEAAAAGDE
ncbi:MAG: RodZ domain-containing protein [Pseudomonadota bacterium]